MIKRLTTVKEIKGDANLNEDLMSMGEVDGRLLGRLSRGKRARKWIVYPDDNFRTNWDLLSTS
jgi:hypothetical protein